MQYFDWSATKNTQLKIEREISFEEVIVAINDGRLLDIIEHPNKKKFPGQKIFIIEVSGYAYLVPFVENEEKIFLQTIIPSRKATRDHVIRK